MKHVFVILGLFIFLVQFSQSQATQDHVQLSEGDSQEGQLLTLRDKVDDAFFLYENGEPSSVCFEALTKLDFSDEHVEDVHLERMEAATLSLLINHPEFALRVLEYNITSPSIPYISRVHSLSLAHFSGCAAQPWKLRALSRLNESFFERYNQEVGEIQLQWDEETPLETVMSLVMLNCEMSLQTTAEKIWNIRSQFPASEDINKKWASFLKDCENLGIHLELKDDSNLLLSQTLEFQPHWLVFMRIRTKGEIEKGKEKRPRIALAKDELAASFMHFEDRNN